MGGSSFWCIQIPNWEHAARGGQYFLPGMRFGAYAGSLSAVDGYQCGSAAVSLVAVNSLCAVPVLAGWEVPSRFCGAVLHILRASLGSRVQNVTTLKALAL